MTRIEYITEIISLLESAEIEILDFIFQFLQKII